MSSSNHIGVKHRGTLGSSSIIHSVSGTEEGSAGTIMETNGRIDSGHHIYNNSHSLDNQSHHNIDTSLPYNTSSHNISNRTLSSSSSMISTPSNRKMQHRSSIPKAISNKMSQNARLVKGKLLNLQHSKRFVARQSHYRNNEGSDSMDESEDSTHPNKVVPGFIIHKPVNTSSYDYGAFTNYPSGVDLQHGDHLPPAVKQSQIRAWESAERISRNVIFGEDDDDNDDDDDEHEGEDHNDDRSSDSKQPIIMSIPGYTKDELDIVVQLDNELKSQRQPMTTVNVASRENEETRMLYELKKKHQVQNERVFQKSNSLTQRRQIQVGQKKELLRRVFGYQNTLNVDYITNNTSYSTLDSSANVQKTFHEDKEEIACLIDEDQAFNLLLEETRERHKNPNALTDEIELEKSSKQPGRELVKNFDYGRFQHIVRSKLNRIYADSLRDADEYQGDFESDEEDYFNNDAELNNEMQLFSMAYLRRCIRE